MKYTTNLKLKKPEPSDFVEIGDINENMDVIDAKYQELSKEVREKATEITYAELIMTASGWQDSQYSFESIYPASQFDLSIQPNHTCTTEQLDAYSAARLLGRIDSNVVRAAGDMPTVDIPIIARVIRIGAGQPEPQAQMLIFGETDTGKYVEIDGIEKNVQNIVDSEKELTEGSYTLQIL